MDDGAIKVKYMFSVLKNSTDRLFEGKDQCLVSKRSCRNIYMYITVAVMKVGLHLMFLHHGYMELFWVTQKKTT